MWFDDASVFHLPLQTAASALHLVTLWAFTEALLKAPRECRCKTVPEDSRHLINI